MIRASGLCSLAYLGALLGVLAAAPAHAANSGTGLVCIPVIDIKGSPAIDDKTILLELRGGTYKRVDLAGHCPDLTWHGFSFATSTDDLCSSNALHVNEPVGAVCLIKDVVDIDKDEAKMLLKGKKG